MDADDYRAAEQADLANAIADGKTAIENAADTAAVAIALANAKTAIDAIKTDAELTAEEEAAVLVEKAQDWVSVRIDDQICINFKLALRDGFRSVTIEYIDQDLQTATKTVVYDELIELTIIDGHYLIPVVIAPAQIGDTIRATLIVDGQEIVYTMSVKDYCEYLIANYNGENAAAVIALAKATLEYGQAANEYFGYADAFATTDAAQAAVDAAKAIPNTLSASGDIRSKITNAAFMALTQPEFCFYTTGITEEEAAELNDSGKIITNVDGATAKFYKNGDAILLEVTGIEAKDMDMVITVTVGDLGTITFSGNDFARMMANSGDESIQTLGAALYLYGAADAACFA